MHHLGSVLVKIAHAGRWACPQITQKWLCPPTLKTKLTPLLGVETGAIRRDIVGQSLPPGQGGDLAAPGGQVIAPVAPGGRQGAIAVPRGGERGGDHSPAGAGDRYVCYVRHVRCVRYVRKVRYTRCVCM